MRLTLENIGYISLIFLFFFVVFYFSNNIEEGMDNCNAKIEVERNKMIFENNKTINVLKENVDNLMKSYQQLILSDENRSTKLNSIEKEIEQAEKQMNEANIDSL